MNARRSVLTIAVVGGLIEFIALHFWVRGGYWNFSDGVYAMSSRQWLHGLVPYRAWAGAQPPPIFMVGTALLAIADDVTSLRIGLGVVDLICAALVARCVFLLDGRAWLALATGAASALLPTTLLNHAQLIPETLAAPLLLAGALLCADQRRDWIGVLVLVLAAWFKVAFLLPALTIALASPRRWRNTGAVLAGFCLVMGLSVAIFGAAEWRETVTAQFGLPHPRFSVVAGVLAQEAWNDVALAAGVVLFAVLWRRSGSTPRLRHPALAGTLLGASVGGMALALSVYKLGSYGYVLGVAEGPALVLSVCAVAWSWQHAGKVLRVLVVAATLLMAAQSVSVLVDPGNPDIATRPGAASGPGEVMDRGQLAAALAAATHCARTQAYSGPPEIAFLAGLRMPGNQPDLFMLQNAATDARFDVLASADKPDCP